MRVSRSQLEKIIQEKLTRLIESEGNDTVIGPTSNLGIIGFKIEESNGKKSDYNFYKDFKGLCYAYPQRSETPTDLREIASKDVTAKRLNYRIEGDPSTYFNEDQE